MNFIKDLWHRIVSSNDEPYILKIKELEAELNITKICNIPADRVFNATEYNKHYTER